MLHSLNRHTVIHSTNYYTAHYIILLYSRALQWIKLGLHGMWTTWRAYIILYIYTHEAAVHELVVVVVYYYQTVFDISVVKQSYGPAICVYDTYILYIIYIYNAITIHARTHTQTNNTQQTCRIFDI